MAKAEVRHRKEFRLLQELLDLPGYATLGLLEWLYQSAFAAADPELGSARSVAEAAGWDGDAHKLVEALDEARFIVPSDRPGWWRLPDFWVLAPEYVRKRLARRGVRQEDFNGSGPPDGGPTEDKRQPDGGRTEAERLPHQNQDQNQYQDQDQPLAAANTPQRRGPERLPGAAAAAILSPPGGYCGKARNLLEQLGLPSRLRPGDREALERWEQRQVPWQVLEAAARAVVARCRVEGVSISGWPYLVSALQDALGTWSPGQPLPEPPDPGYREYLLRSWRQSPPPLGLVAAIAAVTSAVYQAEVDAVVAVFVRRDREVG